MAQREITAMRAIQAEHGGGLKQEFAPPTATHFVRCSLKGCNTPISTHNVARTVKSHLARVHPNVLAAAHVTLVRFNAIRLVKFTIPPRSKRAL